MATVVVVVVEWLLIPKEEFLLEELAVVKKDVVVEVRCADGSDVPQHARTDQLSEQDKQGAWQVSQQLSEHFHDSWLACLQHDEQLLFHSEWARALPCIHNPGGR